MFDANTRTLNCNENELSGLNKTTRMLKRDDFFSILSLIFSPALVSYFSTDYNIVI
jgi:hypothetical protein